MGLMRFVGSGLSLALIVLCGSTGAAAAPLPTNTPVVQAVTDCRKVDDPVGRLACYDKAVDAMVAAANSGELVTLDREQRRQARREVFGFALPSLAILDRGEKPDELNRVAETVAAAFHNGQGKWVFRMQDGAVWRQIDDNDLSRMPRAGSAAVIRRAALGSFLLSLDGQPGIRVHRDN
jgi:hypothetical protein